jgi:hypothetical protein
VRVTHPFHPLFGRSFELLNCRFNWGEQRVQFRDEQGQVFLLPASWTDVVAADPFVVMAAGRSPFRAIDLIELAVMLNRLQSDHGEVGHTSVKEIAPGV